MNTTKDTQKAALSTVGTLCVFVGMLGNHFGVFIVPSVILLVVGAVLAAAYLVLSVDRR